MTKEQVLAVLDRIGLFLMMRGTGEDKRDLQEVRAAIASWPEPGEAVAWMRKWVADGVDVMAMPKRERPRGWNMKDVTVSKLLSDDVPLYAAPPSMSALLAELRGLKTYDITEGGGVYESDRGDIIDWHELAAILSRYQESK